MSNRVENDSFNPDISNVPFGRNTNGDKNGEKAKSKGVVGKMQSMLMLRRTRVALGVIIGFFGVYLLLSCISFFVAGAGDQSEVINTAVAQQDAENIGNKGAIFGA